MSAESDMQPTELPVSATTGWMRKYYFSLVSALILVLFAYDRAVSRRIHPVTVGGFTWFYAIWAIVVIL